MSFELIGIILFAAFLHAAWNAIVKGGSNKLYEIGLNCFGGGMILFAVPFLPLPDPESWKFMVGSSTTHIVYYLCVYKAYQKVDLSYAYTLMRGTSPLLTSMAMIALGADMTTAAWVGLMCLCAGVFSLAWDSVHRGSFNMVGTMAALGTAVVIMGYTLFDGYGARSSGNPISYVCWLYVLNTFPINIYICLRERRQYWSYFKTRWQYGVLGGVCSLGSYGVALWAMTKAPIALVAALRETSVVFGMLLSVLFLGEKFTVSRLVAVLLVTAGTAVMKMQ